MPVICVFENEHIKIYIYNFDHNEPHIHIVKKGTTSPKGVDMLLDGTLPHGSEGLSKSDIRLVQNWLATHLEEVNDKWQQAVEGELTGESPISPKLEAVTKQSSEGIYATDVIPLPGKRILTEFNHGYGYTLFNMAGLLNKPSFAKLSDDNVFYNVDFSRGVPSWDNENIDIAPEHLYEKGKPVTKSEYDYIRLMLDIAKRTGMDDNLLASLLEGYIATIGYRE